MQKGPKLQRSLCRKRSSTQILRTENFRYLKNGDQKKFSNEKCESLTRRRYAVLVQDLATQRLQAYLCKTKTSQETEKESARNARAESQP